VIEVHEVCPEVFERKEVVGCNGKDLPHAKPKDIFEFLLYPELSDDRIFFPVGSGVRVERSELREQSLGRNLSPQSVAPEEIESKHCRRIRLAAEKGPGAANVEVKAGSVVLRSEIVARLLVEGCIGDPELESVILIEIRL
jgi:hypothetical protein